MANQSSSCSEGTIRQRLVRRVSLDSMSEYFQNGGVQRVMQKFETREPCGDCMDQGGNNPHFSAIRVLEVSVCNTPAFDTTVAIVLLAQSIHEACG